MIARLGRLLDGGPSVDAVLLAITLVLVLLVAVAL